MTTRNTTHTPGQKLTDDGRYAIQGNHNCGCRILQPMGAKYSIISYCPKHAAAPDLLAALKWALKNGTFKGAGDSLINGGSYDKARAAIAKAKGL